MIDLSKFRGPISWSILSILIILTYGIVSILNSISPLLERSTEIAGESQTASLLEQHEMLITMDIARFEGRSAFFKPIRKAPPPPPPPPAPTVEEQEPVDTGPPPPPPAPATYMGPELIAIIGDEAWFRGSGSGAEAVMRLKAGVEKDGLKVVSTTLPSMVTVEYRRGVYEIDLFVVEEPFFLQEVPDLPDTSFLKEVDQIKQDSTPS
ncbi:MAG: hypothetical protein H8E91_01840 [Planctomycetes bacterium]|nr:hypothetical protein [Planctomycetota bacterium]